MLHRLDPHRGAGWVQQPDRGECIRRHLPRSGRPRHQRQLRRVPGALRIDGTVLGNVIVINGDARVRRTGDVTGDITVLGGHLTCGSGRDNLRGGRFECEEPVALMQLPDGTIARRPAGRSLRNSRPTSHSTPAHSESRRTSALASTTGSRRSRSRWGRRQPASRLRTTACDSAATASSAPPAIRAAAVPGSAGMAARRMHDGCVAVHGGRGGRFDHQCHGRSFVLGACVRLERGVPAPRLSRLVPAARRLFGSVRPTPELTVSAAIDVSRQTTVLAVDAFSLLHGTEPWRPNPLIDDGSYRTLSAGITWDARSEVTHPVLNWYAQAEVRRVTSNDLAPVSLPTTIRESLPRTGYGETEASFDLRGYLRLDPAQRLAARISGAGYLGGDPLTIQNRRAISGADPLMGYPFRAINCDRRLKPDPAMPALCDREMAVQLEYRRTLPLDFSTRIGGYTIGVNSPDLVLFSDAGSAWLAGDSAGRVPNNRIQSLAEWRSDVGIGITTGTLGLLPRQVAGRRAGHPAAATVQPAVLAGRCAERCTCSPP